MLMIAPRTYIRLTLLAMILAVTGGMALGFEIASVPRAGLVGLVVATVSLLLVVWTAPDLVRYGLSVIWLTVGVLVVERAIAAGSGGWVAVGGWLLANLIATAIYAWAFKARRMLTVSRRSRALAVSEHERFVAERRELARRDGLRYEQAVPELAEGFGRLAQAVPDDFVEAEGRRAPGIAAATRQAPRVERMRIVLEHAAGLQAQAVVRAQIMGVPVVAFDLEILDHDMLLDRDQVGHVASTLSTDGIAAADVQRGMSYVARLAAALPWHELERDHAMLPAGERSRRVYHRTYRRGQALALERWVERNAGRSDLHIHERAEVALWTRAS